MNADIAPVKLHVFFGVVLLGLAGRNVVADGTPDINEKSPDGKWIFKAHWYGTKGYSWELDDAKSGKSYFVIANPETQPAPRLAKRLSMLWSQENHYLAIDAYYDREDYHVIVVSLKSDPPGFIDWTTPTPASMIKHDDTAVWHGDGTVNCSATKWGKSDTLFLDIDMHAELADAGSGQSYKIQSARAQTVQFIGLKSQAAHDEPPQYDKQPSRND